MVFLGMLLDGEQMVIAIPEEKRTRAINMLKKFTEKKKATVKEIKALCWYLNFLNRAIFPGRVFMHRMYSKYSHMCNNLSGYRNGKEHKNKFTLKPFHHIKLDKEFKADCQIWLKFLTFEDLYKVVNRPMIDLHIFSTSTEIEFFSDTSAAKHLGFGCILGSKWLYEMWEPNFIEDFNPSIEFLELFALCTSIITWQWEPILCNTRIIIFCDNMSVVEMVNNNASKCKRCLYLLRILTLNCLIHNCRISV